MKPVGSQRIGIVSTSQKKKVTNFLARVYTNDLIENAISDIYIVGNPSNDHGSLVGTANTHTKVNFHCLQLPSLGFFFN